MHIVTHIEDHGCGQASQPVAEILPAETPRPETMAAAAHDLANLLQVAASALNQIERNLDSGTQQHLLQFSHAAAFALDRAGALSHRLIGRAAAHEQMPESMCPASALRAIRPLIVLAAGPLVRVDFELCDDAPLLDCEIHAFENVVLNLVTNARNAMPDGGRVRVSLARSRDEALLCVRDNGPGMSATTMASAFAPYFTTRRGAGGHGLGLATVRQFADLNHGWVEMDSAPGRGTAVTLGLPGRR